MQKLYSDIITFTKQLVEIPSQSGVNSEEKIANLVAKKLFYFGFTPAIIGNKNHPSVFCKINKNLKSKTVWLEACLDTALAGDIKKWRYQPFKAIIKGSKMYGRGVADSKIGIAIFCYLAKELYNDPTFKGNIILGFDANEQSGEYSGIKDIIKEKKPKADICVLGYQGIKEISIGARGWLRFKIITNGKSAHTGNKTKKGNNAIHQMADVIAALRKLNFESKKEPFFDYGSAFNVSLIKGGISINIVPDECEISVDIRFLPSQSKQQILHRINNVLNLLKNKKHYINYKIKFLGSEPPFLTSPENTFVKLLQKFAQNELKFKIPLTTSGQGSVGSVIIRKLKTPIINSFGCDCGNAHTYNEWVNINDLPKIFEIYKKTILEFSKI